MKPFLPKGLFAQLVLLLSLILVATIVSFGWIMSRKQESLSRQMIHANAHAMAQSLAESSLHYLLLQDYAGLSSFLLRASEFPDVYAITACEPDGTVVAEAVRQGDRTVEITDLRIDAVPSVNAPSIIEERDHLVVWHPVMSSSLIGWIRISYGLEAIAELRRVTWTSTALLLSVWVPLGVLLLSLVVRQPVNAISRLAAFARQLSGVRGEQVSGPCPSVELRQLQAALNTASNELWIRERQLLAEREELRLNEERFEALYQLSCMVGESEEAITEFALEQGVRLTKSAGGYLHFFNEDEGTISLYRWSAAVRQFCTAAEDSHYPLERSGVWADSIRTRMPVVHNDFDSLAGRKGYPAGHFPVRRHMSIPVIDDGRIVAVAGVGNKELPYEDTDVRQLQIFMQEMWQHLKRKRAEQDMRNLQAQLQQAQKMEAIGHLAGGVAHDFNNLLTAILGYGNILKMKLAVDDPLRMHAEQVILASQKAADLTRGLLAFSRKQIINPVPMDLNEIVQGIGKILLRVIGEDIQLRIEVADRPLGVLVDRGQIDQVLMNLATNARDAMPSGGTLTISTALFTADDLYVRSHLLDRAGPYAVMTVADSGAGMNRETQEHIFEPFFTTKDQRGTGLGLSIVFGIVKQHNGAIKVYSEQGRGTSFKIFLPLHSSRPADISAPAPPPPGGTETILIAEDEESVCTLLSTILTEAGYRVLLSSDGESAVAAFLEHRNDIALLLFDVIMPRKNGRAAFTEIHALAPSIRAIFMSGYNNEAAGIGELLGKDVAFLTKPIEPRELLEQVRRILDA